MIILILNQSNHECTNLLPSRYFGISHYYKLAMVDALPFFLAAHGLAGWGMVHLRTDSPYRYVVLVFIIACCLQSTRSQYIRAIPGLIGLEYTMGFMFHAMNFLCLAKLTPPPKRSSRSNRYQWAFHQLFDPRWGVKLQCSRIWSKQQFLICQIFDSLWLSAILFVHQNWRLNIQPDDLLNYPDGFLLRLSTITAREWIIRLYVYLVAMFIPYCTLRLLHCIVSVFAVLCGDNPLRWPPLFGSIKEAFTIRNYYA